MAAGAEIHIGRAAVRWRTQPRIAGATAIVDIDGVLSDASGRQHFLNNAEGKRDWHGFFGAVGDDPALPGPGRLLDLLHPDVTVALLSGRPSWVIDVTVDWLERHGIRWDLLLLRDDGDLADAASYKRDVLAELRGLGYDVQLAFDDDRRIVAMYHDAGVPCIYLHSGYYG
jgi:hypothetical protein